MYLDDHRARDKGGSHDRAVLCLSGCPTPPEYFTPIVERLAPQRVLVAHLPGYGRDRADTAPNAIEVANAELLHELGAREIRRVAVIGYSLGAYRALRLAQSAPQLVSQLYLLGALVGVPDDERALFQGFIDLLMSDDPLPDIAPSRFLSEPSLKRAPQLADAVRAWMSCAPRRVIADELVALLAGPDLLGAVATLDCPITCRVGALDVATPPARSQAIVERASQGTLEVVPGAGHALLYEDELATLDSIAAALTRPR